MENMQSPEKSRNLRSVTMKGHKSRNLRNETMSRKILSKWTYPDNVSKFKRESRQRILRKHNPEIIHYISFFLSRQFFLETLKLHTSQ